MSGRRGGSPTRIIVIMYGQSNMNAMLTTTATPPTPASNTFIYNSSTGTLDVPGTLVGPTAGNGNGVINLLNGIAAANPGRVIIAIDGAQDGSAINNLSKADPGTFGSLNTVYQTMIGMIRAVRRANDQTVIIWHQGEGDTEKAPHMTEKDYKDNLSQLHTDLVTDMGTTKAQVPLFIGTLGTGSAVFTPSPVGSGKPDQSFFTIRSAHINAALEQTNVHLSHSSMDFARVDAYHWAAAGYGAAGNRFAQSINTYLGLAAGEARFTISSAAFGTATTTLVNVAHVLGTDFTVGTDGWQVSGNNGATWIAATPSRVSATQISLSHASLASLSRARLVRYQYGQNPTVASPVKDNSALAVPLLPTTWDIVPTNPTTVIPVPTWRTTTQRSYNADGSVQSGATQVYNNLPLGPGSYQRFLILGIVGGINVGATSVVVTPNVGSAVTATLVQQVANSTVAIYKAPLLTDANTATQVSVQLNFASNPFAENSVTLWTVPSSDLTSQVETGKNGLNVAAGTAATATLNVSAGGFAVGIARNSNNTGSGFGSITSPIGTSSGSTTTGDSWAQRWEYVTGTELQSGDASNLVASASSSVTFNFIDSGSLDVAVAAWR